MMPFGTERLAQALAVHVPTLPMGESARDWAVGGATGAGVRVAIVDSGIDGRHPDAGQVSRAVVGRRGDDGEVTIVDDIDGTDVVGHGTACAGVIRALAPDVELFSVRVLDGDLRGNARMFATGLDWAIGSGAHVVNLSLSTANENWYAAFHDLSDQAYFGGTVLVGALNNDPRPSYPTDFATVISVASLPVDAEGPLVYNPDGPAEFGAPGIDVRVPWLDGGYATVTGNSFAAPYVSGLVALMRSKHPWLRPFQVKTVLQAIAVNAADPMS